MDVLILRLLLDASFFLAIFNPLIAGGNQALRWGLTAILAIWLVWIVLNWKKRNLEGRVQDIASTEVKVLAVVQVYEIVIQGFSKWQQTCVPYLIVFAVTVILFLRAGRLVGGSQEKTKFWGANSVELLLVLGLAAVCSSETVKNFAWNLLKNSYMKLVLPVIMGFLNLLQAVFLFLEPLLEALLSGVEIAENEVALDTRTGQDFLQLTGNEALAETPLWAKAAGVLVVVAVLAVVFYFLYIRLSVAGSGRDRKIQGEVKKSTIGAGERKTIHQPTFFEEKNVRHYYRKFLGLCRKKGVHPEKAMVTTEMMRQTAVYHWGEEESVDALTELYREVRYGGAEDAEPQRKKAKELVKTIRSAADAD